MLPSPESGFPTSVPSSSSPFPHTSSWAQTIQEAPSEELTEYGSGGGESSSKRETTPRPFRADHKGKGRAVPVGSSSNIEDFPAGSASGSGSGISVSPFATMPSIGGGDSTSTPPASSRLSAPPNPHSGWPPSSYTLATTQMGDDSPSKPRPRRRDR